MPISCVATFFSGMTPTLSELHPTVLQQTQGSADTTLHHSSPQTTKTADNDPAVRNALVNGVYLITRSSRELKALQAFRVS